MKLYALISVSDKTGVESLASALSLNGYKLLATGGTYKFLKSKEFEVTEVSEFTKEPEKFGGRLKTLTPKILGGILYRPGTDDAEWDEDYRIGAVVCNFYPFEEKSQDISSLSELIEWIDIGGPNMVRAAAKNFEHVWVFTRAEQYSRFIAAPEHGLDLRARFALEAFEKVAEYGNQVVEGFQRVQMGTQILGQLESGGRLRYGENPHQAARFHPNRRIQPKFLGAWSFNNVKDADAALKFVSVFRGPAVAVVKHQNLCGAAASKDSNKNFEVFNWAWEGDPVSRFGGVVALNFEPTAEILEVFEKKFIEVVLLPRNSKTEEWAAHWVRQKERLKVGLVDFEGVREGGVQKEIWTSVLGKLEQDIDRPSWVLDACEYSILDAVGEWSAACSKSNALVLCGEKDGVGFLCGGGQGQPNRIDALEKLALPRAQEFAKRKNFSLEKMTAYSDGFFPFDDAVKILAAQKIKRVVHPGGSKADIQVSETAKSLGVEVEIKPPRHFWH